MLNMVVLRVEASALELLFLSDEQLQKQKKKNLSLVKVHPSLAERPMPN